MPTLPRDNFLTYNLTMRLKSIPDRNFLSVVGYFYGAENSLHVREYIPTNLSFPIRKFNVVEFVYHSGNRFIHSTFL